MLTAGRLSPQRAASAWLVYLTAWVALTELGSVAAGDWLLVTAANSALGLAACDVGRSLGARTIGAVRSSASAEAIRDAGFEAIIRTDEVRLGDAVRDVTEGGAHVALDCVLGDIGAECLRALRPYGTLVVYGALSGQPLELRGGLVIARQPTVRGLWLGQWLQDRRPGLAIAGAELVAGRGFRRARGPCSRAQCHICGRVFRTLATHVWRTHEVWAEEYRAYFGLRARRTSWGKAPAPRLRAAATSSAPASASRGDRVDSMLHGGRGRTNHIDGRRKASRPPQD